MILRPHKRQQPIHSYIGLDQALETTYVPTINTENILLEHPSYTAPIIPLTQLSLGPSTTTIPMQVLFGGFVSLSFLCIRVTKLVQLAMALQCRNAIPAFKTQLMFIGSVITRATKLAFIALDTPTSLPTFAYTVICTALPVIRCSIIALPAPPQECGHRS